MISDINKFAMVTQDSANQHFKRQSNQQFTSVNSLINSNLQRPSHDCNQNNTSHPSTYKPSSIWVQPDPSLTSIYSLWLQGSPHIPKSKPDNSCLQTPPLTDSDFQLMTSDVAQFAMVTQDSSNQHFKKQSNQQLTSVNCCMNSDLHKQSRDCNTTQHPSENNKTNNAGITSVDRSTKATLTLTVPGCVLSRLQKIYHPQVWNCN